MYAEFSLGEASLASVARSVKVVLTTTAESASEALDVQPITFLATITAESSGKALSAKFIVYLSSGIAESSANALNAALSASGLVGASLGVAESSAKALDSDITFIIDGIPDIIVERTSPTQATVEVTNLDNTDFRIYRADDYNEGFSQLTFTSTNPYTDSGLDNSKNYKYKVSFALQNTASGAISEGVRSSSRYTSSYLQTRKLGVTKASAIALDAKRKVT